MSEPELHATDDPCPGCLPGGFCRTFSCGRLKALQVGSTPTQSVSSDTLTPRPLKDHEIAKFVNTLVLVAVSYRESQQLRCQLRHVVLGTLTSHHLKAKP